MSSRVSFYIDGFNIYHAIKDMKNNRIKWLNYRLLCESFLKPDEIIKDIYYFSAYATWKKDRYLKHKIFVEALKTENIKVVLGKFKEKKDTAGKIYHEEKESDVNLAINLLNDAHHNKFDKAIILSADSDFVPVIKMIKTEFPNLIIGCVIKAKVKANELINSSDFKIFLNNVKQKDLLNFRLKDSILKEDGNTIFCPKDWM